MIDVAQLPPPPAYEQVLTEKLLHCGLRNGGFTVKYEDELQSVEVIIDKETRTSAGHFDCIRQAAGHGIVTFKDSELQGHMTAEYLNRGDTESRRLNT